MVILEIRPVPAGPLKLRIVVIHKIRIVPIAISQGVKFIPRSEAPYPAAANAIAASAITTEIPYVKLAIKLPLLPNTYSAYPPFPLFSNYTYHIAQMHKQDTSPPQQLPARIIWIYFPAAPTWRGA